MTFYDILIILNRKPTKQAQQVGDREVTRVKKINSESSVLLQ